MSGCFFSPANPIACLRVPLTKLRFHYGDRFLVKSKDARTVLSKVNIEKIVL
jgi:hypothetical protein